VPLRLPGSRQGDREKHRKLLSFRGTIVVLFACSNANCVHGVLTLRDYRSMLCEQWDQSFSNQLSLATKRLYATNYNKPPLQTNPDGKAYRSCYPCGIVEQAYLDLRARGVPLMKPLGPIGRARRGRSANEERSGGL